VLQQPGLTDSRVTGDEGDCLIATTSDLETVLDLPRFDISAANGRVVSTGTYSRERAEAESSRLSIISIHDSKITSEMKVALAP